MQPEGICPVRFLFPICVVRTDCQCAGNAAAVSANRSAVSDWEKFAGGLYLFALGLSKKKGAALRIPSAAGCRHAQCGRAVRHGCLAGDAVLYAAAAYFDFQRLLRYGAGHCSYAWHGAAGELRFSHKASTSLNFGNAGILR